MFRFAPGLLGVVLFILWMWAIFDVIATDRILVRNLDKMAWLFIVIIVPTVGAVAWLALGRPVNAGFRPGSTAIRRPAFEQKPAPRGVEDSDAWRHDVQRSNPSESGAAKERRLLEWEAELAKREADLDDNDGSKDTES